MVFIILVLQGYNGLIRENNEPVPSKLPEKPKILVFYEEGWGGIYSGSMERLTKVKEKVALVSPVWLSLKADAGVNWDKTDFHAIKFFAENKLEFIPLVTAGSGRNGSLPLERASWTHIMRNWAMIISNIGQMVKSIRSGGKAPGG